MNGENEENTESGSDSLGNKYKLFQTISKNFISLLSHLIITPFN